MNLVNKKINFLGDSITQGAAASSPDLCYVGLLKKICELSEVRNYGLGGTRIAKQKNPSVLVQYDKDFILRCEEMNTDADIVIIFGGTNDFGHGDAELGKINDDTVYTFCGAYNILIDKLKGLFPKSLIICITPMHRIDETNSKGEGNKANDGNPLIDYVNSIKTIATNRKINVFDLFSDEDLNPKNLENKKNYYFDGIHPNDNGHRLLAEKIKKYLEAL